MNTENELNKKYSEIMKDPSLNWENVINFKFDPDNFEKDLEKMQNWIDFFQKEIDELKEEEL